MSLTSGMTGQKFNRLLVLEFISSKLCLCLCDCGKTKEISPYSILSENTKSCGCLSDEVRDSKRSKLTKNEKSRLLKEKNIREGFCRNHAGVPAVLGLTICEICQNYNKTRTKLFAKLGKCDAHPSVILNGRICPECQEVLRAYHKNKIDNGICPSCPTDAPKPIVSGTKHCQDCLINQRVRNLKTAGVRGEELEKAKRALRDFDGHCDCCDTTEVGKRGWHLDHCHKTFKFRGVLCSNCNQMLGIAKESPERLEAGAVYIQKNLLDKSISLCNT